MANPFEDVMDEFFNSRREPSPGPGHNRSDLNAEKGVRIEGHDQGGTYYVRLDQVVELLSINGVLPKATAKFKTFLENR